MPELPDIAVYIERLQARVVGSRLREVRLLNPFVLRTAVPPLSAVEGQAVVSVERLGKRIVFGFGADGPLLVIHLMIAGRLKWLADGDKLPAPARSVLAVLRFDSGRIAFTEAGTTRRASMHVLADRAALRAMDPGGIDVLAADEAAFAAQLARENHTLKRSLTDPRLFSGIGNAYSDEILHRARLSPVALSRSLKPDEVRRLHEATRTVLVEWTDRPATGRARSPRSIRRWPCTAATASPARSAPRRCSASSTPTTRPTTARAARPAAACSPTGRCRRC
jgi:formamidopyrimidine-DNA glycosylase